MSARSFGSIEQLTSGRFRIRYLVDGHRYTGERTFRTKGEARTALAHIASDLARGTWADPLAPTPPSTPTFADALTEYCAHRVRLGKLRQMTADGYVDIAARWLGCGDEPSGFGATPVDRITRADCDAVIAESVSRGHRPATTANVKRVISAVLRFAERNRQWIERNPAEGLELPAAHVNRNDDEHDDPHAMRCITADEVMALAAAFDFAPHGLVVRTTVFGGGLRASEVQGLRVGDFDPQAGTLSVLRRVREGKVDRPKSDRSRRTNHVPGWLLDELSAHCAGRDAAEPMFAMPSGAPFSMDNWRYSAFSEAKRAAGIAPAFRFHDLRHTAASLLLAAGVPVVDVSRFLGHSNPTVTLSIYAHVVPGEHDRPARAFDGVATDYAAASARRRLRVVGA